MGSDKLGNKQDLLSELTAIKAQLDRMSLVIGQLTDGETDSTIYGFTHTTNEHNHAKAICYPTLAAGVTLTGGVAAWALGNIVQIVPPNAITAPFDIHGIGVETFNANDTFEFILYSDSGGLTEIGRARVTRLSNVGGSPEGPFQTPILPANNGVWGKVGTKNGTSNQITITLRAHVY